jgi:hypothetical protein
VSTPKRLEVQDLTRAEKLFGSAVLRAAGWKESPMFSRTGVRWYFRPWLGPDGRRLAGVDAYAAVTAGAEG